LSRKKERKDFLLLNMGWVTMKAHEAVLKVGNALQGPIQPHLSVPRQSRSKADVVTRVDEHPFLVELAEGPYCLIASMFDASTLSQTDATCRTLCTLNRAHMGPWRVLGAQTFEGLELEQDGIFEKAAQDNGLMNGRKVAGIDWKRRFARFLTGVPTFCAPFQGQHITSVSHPDEVAYFRSKLCTDVFDVNCAHGVYLEIEVLLNPDNLSMALVDFEAGGCSSVTFSPDTGAVICERKVCETPRKVEGAYIQPLNTLPQGQRFHGIMGLYLCGGGLAFFRRCADVSSGKIGKALGPYETTGFVSDLSWAEGNRLTPSVAFRGEGEYSVRIVRVDKYPPLPVGRPSADLQKRVGWSVFDWEAGEEDEA